MIFCRLLNCNEYKQLPRISPAYCPLHYGCDLVLLRRPVTPKGFILSPPRHSTVDSWRREAEEFLR